jgi:hypothetical protein
MLGHECLTSLRLTAIDRSAIVQEAAVSLFEPDIDPVMSPLLRCTIPAEARKAR